MAQLNTLEDALVDELRDIYNAESQLLKALPKMAKKAHSKSLKQAINSHLEETQDQVERLDRISKILDCKLTGKKCAAMEGLIEEGREVIEEDSDNESLIDALLIGAAQRVEHYEMAAYGTARAMAERLGHDDVVELLQESLDEEGAANKKLTAISQDEVLDEALNRGGTEHEEEEEETNRSVKVRSKKNNGQKRRQGIHAASRKSRR